MDQHSHIIIGAKERISFKDALRVKVIARIDTGAKTSSVHCIKYWFDKQDGKKALNFILISDKARTIRTFDYKKRYVKSSNGEVDVRYAVNLNVSLGGDPFECEFTLALREKMRHKVLLGRNFLSGRYLVDVDQKFLLSTSSEKK